MARLSAEFISSFVRNDDLGEYHNIPQYMKYNTLSRKDWASYLSFIFQYQDCHTIMLVSISFLNQFDFNVS